MAERRTHGTPAKSPAGGVTYIECPYSERDRASQLGAKFDQRQKQWYVPEGVSLDLFKEWIHQRKYLNSEYHEKDEIKALGARFDSWKKKWYISEDADPAPFKKWLGVDYGKFFDQDYSMPVAPGSLSSALSSKPAVASHPTITSTTSRREKPSRKLDSEMDDGRDIDIERRRTKETPRKRRSIVASDEEDSQDSINEFIAEPEEIEDELEYATEDSQDRLLRMTPGSAESEPESDIAFGDSSASAVSSGSESEPDPYRYKLHCHICDEWMHVDNFSAAQKKLADEYEIYCLKHTSTSAFNAKMKQVRKPNAVYDTSDEESVPDVKRMGKTPKRNQYKNIAEGSSGAKKKANISPKVTAAVASSVVKRVHSQPSQHASSSASKARSQTHPPFFSSSSSSASKLTPSHRRTINLDEDEDELVVKPPVSRSSTSSAQKRRSTTVLDDDDEEWEDETTKPSADTITQASRASANSSRHNTRSTPVPAMALKSTAKRTLTLPDSDEEFEALPVAARTDSGSKKAPEVIDLSGDVPPIAANTRFNGSVKANDDEEEEEEEDEVFEIKSTLKRPLQSETATAAAGVVQSSAKKKRIVLEVDEEEEDEGYWSTQESSAASRLTSSAEEIQLSQAAASTSGQVSGNPQAKSRQSALSLDSRVRRALSDDESFHDSDDDNSRRKSSASSKAKKVLGSARKATPVAAPVDSGRKRTKLPEDLEDFIADDSDEKEFESNRARKRSSSGGGGRKKQRLAESSEDDDDDEEEEVFEEASDYCDESSDRGKRRRKKRGSSSKNKGIGTYSASKTKISRRMVDSEDEEAERDRAVLKRSQSSTSGGRTPGSGSKKRLLKRAFGEDRSEDEEEEETELEEDFSRRHPHSGRASGSARKSGGVVARPVVATRKGFAAEEDLGDVLDQSNIVRGKRRRNAVNYCELGGGGGDDEY